MALTFTSSTSKVEVAEDASIDDLDPLTWMCWVKHVSGGFDRILWKGTTSTEKAFMTISGGDASFTVEQSGTDLNFRTNDGRFTDNTWHFVAAKYDSSKSPRAAIYVGDLDTVATESSYVTSNSGSGTPSVESDPLFIGNRNGGDRGFNGDIAIVHIEARYMALSQIIQWQFKPRVLTDTRLHMHLGFNALGSQPDWSGNNNTGTQTATTVADHVPLGGPFFGLDLEWMGNFTAAAGPVGTGAKSPFQPRSPMVGPL